jgi:FkbM family methyltransferase
MATSSARLAALLLEPGGSVLDIGANMGFTALGFLRGGASRVHCIEPNPDMVALIRANVAGPVTVHQVALGDRDGKIDLVIPTGHPGAASIDPSFNAAKVTASGGSKRIPVTLIRLDDLEIERCDFWKVDVEGVEIEAMKGAKKTRAAKPPRWILAEIAGEPFRPPGHLDAFTRAVADTHPLRYEVLSDSLGVTRLVALPLGNAPTTIMERGTGTPLFLFASEPPPEIVP